MHSVFSHGLALQIELELCKTSREDQAGTEMVLLVEKMAQPLSTQLLPACNFQVEMNL